MSSKDEIHSSRIHSAAYLAARDLDQDPAVAAVLQRLAEAADTPAERAEAVGRLAREALANVGQPGTDYAELGRRFIAAGLAAVSGPVDGDRLGEAMRAPQFPEVERAIEEDLATLAEMRRGS